MANLDQAVHDLYKKIDELMPANFKLDIPSPVFVIHGLAIKSRSHCNIAKNIAFNGDISEAVILLRSAYESVILMHYLLRNQAKIQDYQKHALLMQYKNRLLAYSDVNLENPDALSNKIFETLKDTKQQIIDYGLLREPHLFKRGVHKDKKLKPLFENGSILDDPDNYSFVLGNYFADFRAMSKTLDDSITDDYKLSENYQGLHMIKSIVFNLGSQVTHGHWHMVIDLHLGMDLLAKPVIPVLSRVFIFAGISILLEYTFKAMDGIGLTQELEPKLHNALRYVTNQAVAEYREPKCYIFTPSII